MRRYLAFLFLLFIGNANAQTLIDAVIADVEGHAITLSELENEFRIAAVTDGTQLQEPPIAEKRAVLEMLIARKFAFLEAVRIGVVKQEGEVGTTATPYGNYSEQVKAEMKTISAKFPSEEKFHQVLQENGLEIVAVEAWVYARLIDDAFFLRKFVRTVNTAAIEKLALDYFEKHQDEFKDADGNPQEYADVEEELLERFRQQQAKANFDVWLAKQKDEGSWHILDTALAQPQTENADTEDED